MRNWRATPGMALLFLLAVWGVASSPPLTVPQPNQPAKQQHVSETTENNQSAFFLTVGAWARDNRDAIDPLAAIGALAVAAVVALVTGLLYGATRRLAVSTDELARAAHEQSTEMALARTLAEKGLDLEEKQFLLAGRQCDLAENQLGFQREQYLAEHRPRIIIRNIGIARPTTDGAIFQAGHLIKGSLVIVNVGASDATIRRAEYRIHYGGNLPMVPPLDEPGVKFLLDGMLPHNMDGHESLAITIEGNRLDGVEVSQILSGSGPNYLYVFGAILFSDRNLKERWMGFGRIYEPSRTGREGRFVPIENPDYEYED